MSNTPMPTREQVEASRTWIELAEKLRLNPRNDRAMAKIKIFVRAEYRDIQIKGWRRGEGGNYSISDETFTSVVKDARSVADAIKQMGLVPRGGAYKSFYKRTEKLGLDTSHFKGQGWNKGVYHGPKRDIEEYLTNNGLTIGSNALKYRLIREGLKEHKCEECGRTEWNGKDIPIALDHINGVHSDNRIENLRILCPNCHAQTPTFCGRNITNKPSKGACVFCGKEKNLRKSETCGSKECWSLICKQNAAKHPTGTRKTKVSWPDIEELKVLIWKMPMRKVGEQLGVSDNAVRNYCRRRGYSDFPPVGYWTRRS